MRVRVASRLAALAAALVVVSACDASSSATHALPTRGTAQTAPAAALPHSITRRCAPTELRLALRWQRDSTGALSGELRATNPGPDACGLLLKPVVHPLGVDGMPLATQFLTTAEGRYGPSALRPGHTATARVVWVGWCGRPAGTRVEVSWGDVATTVAVSEPRQPACPMTKYAPTNVSSTWFSGLTAE
jgi:hypothetical protein